MPGGAEPKNKKRRKGGDRRDKEKPLLSVQVIQYQKKNALKCPGNIFIIVQT
jgi:hypothetical protein